MAPEPRRSPSRAPSAGWLKPQEKGEGTQGAVTEVTQVFWDHHCVAVQARRAS